jgi:hypothetical protein
MEPNYIGAINKAGGKFNCFKCMKNNEKYEKLIYKNHVHHGERFKCAACGDILKISISVQVFNNTT